MKLIRLTAAVLGVMAIAGCTEITERDYNTLEDRCRRLENDNRNLTRELNQLKAHNAGLSDDVERYSALLEAECVERRDRLTSARRTLATLKTHVGGTRHTDSLLEALDENLKTIVETRPLRARQVHEVTEAEIFK